MVSEGHCLAAGFLAPCPQLQQTLCEPLPRLGCMTAPPSRAAVAAVTPAGARGPHKVPPGCSPLAHSTFTSVTGSWLVGLCYPGGLPSTVLECWGRSPAKPGGPPGGGGSSGGLKASLRADPTKTHHFGVLLLMSPGPVHGGMLQLPEVAPATTAQPCPKGKGPELPGEEGSATRTTGHLLCLDQRKTLGSPAFQGAGVSGLGPKGTRCNWDSSSSGSLAGRWESEETWHAASLCSGRARRARVKCCSERDNTPRQGQGTAGPSPVRAQAPQLCRQRQPRL